MKDETVQIDKKQGAEDDAVEDKNDNQITDVNLQSPGSQGDGENENEAENSGDDKIKKTDIQK